MVCISWPLQERPPLSDLVFWNCFMTPAAGEPRLAPVAAGWVAAPSLAEGLRRALAPALPVEILGDVAMRDLSFLMTLEKPVQGGVSSWTALL
jgi:hypothetical protein